MLDDGQKRSEDQLFSGDRDTMQSREDTDVEEPQADYLEKARELAGSYSQLVKKREWLRQQYEESKSWFYTRDEIIYKLSQGAHEQSERVQTSGTSNPVERTVLNCDKVLASMNREVQSQRTEQFLEPYYKVCEEIELFEVGLRSLRGQTRYVAEQLFVDGKNQSEVVGMDGQSLGRRMVEREKDAALQGIAVRMGLYEGRRKKGWQMKYQMK